MQVTNLSWHLLLQPGLIVIWLNKYQFRQSTYQYIIFCAPTSSSMYIFRQVSTYLQNTQMLVDIPQIFYCFKMGLKVVSSTVFLKIQISLSLFFSKEGVVLVCSLMFVILSTKFHKTIAIRYSWKVRKLYTLYM